MAVGLPGGSLKHPISVLLSNTKRWGLPAKNSFASDGTKEMFFVFEKSVVIGV